MADWFVEVTHGEGDDVEVFEFIDYRKALVFGASFDGDEDVLSVELVDVDGRVLLRFGDEFDGCLGRTSTPQRAGFYRWDKKTEQMRQVAK